MTGSLVTSVLFVASGIVLAVASERLSKLRPPWTRRRKWWMLTPSTAGVKPSLVEFALQDLKRTLQPARSLMIVRIGQPGNRSQVWVGTSAKNGQAVASQVASAAGCELNPCGPPPSIADTTGWRISYAFSKGARGRSKVPVPNNQYLTGLAGNLAANLGAGDAMVLTLVPCRDEPNVLARAAIAAPRLGNSWAHDAKTPRFWPLPSAIGVIQGVAAAFCILRVVEEFTVLDCCIPYPVSEVSVLAAVLFAAVSVFGLLHELRPTRRTRLLVEYLHFPPGLLLRIARWPVNRKHIAGWAKAR